MSKIERTIASVRAVLTSVVTIVTALAVAAQQVAAEADIPVVSHWAGRIAVMLVGVIGIIRRVTPVDKADRGLT